MKTGFRRIMPLVACLAVVVSAFAEGNVKAHRFLKQIETEAPEMFLIPLAVSDPAQPGKIAKRKMERGDEWLTAVSQLVRDREIEFRFMALQLEDPAEAKDYPRAFSWRRGEKCGIVLRRFRDAKSQWLTRWDSGENWMMIVFELMNLEGFPVAGRFYEGESELIESFARSEYRAMQRANDVFHRVWVPYCEKIGAKGDMTRIPWFNRNVAMGEEEWGRQAVKSPALKEYREWIMIGFGHWVRKPDGGLRLLEVE